MIADPKKLDEKLKKLDESDFEEGTSLLEDSVRKFKKNKMAVFGCFMITFLFILSLSAKLVTPYSYDEGKLENQNFPPTWYKSFLSEKLREDLLNYGKQKKEEAKGVEDDFFSDLGSSGGATERPTLEASSLNFLGEMANDSIFTSKKNTLSLTLKCPGRPTFSAQMNWGRIF